MHRPLLALALSAATVWTARPARAEKIKLGDDRFVNLGLLIQPQLVVAQRAAPNGDPGTDLFLRRGRLILSGQLDPRLSFVFITDQPNWAKGGDYSSTFLVQDALASFRVAPELTLSAGFMLVPFVRNNLTSAGALNTVDFRTAVIKFPAGKAFRDAGVEARGLVLDDQLYYRVGVFNGVGGKAATATTPEVNPSDAPRFAGMIRYNLVGKDDGYALSRN